MRCSGWSSLATSVFKARGVPRLLVVAVLGLSSLVASGSAAAHVFVLPPFLESGTSSSITFSGRNERAEPMTAFDLTVPDGFTIEHAHEVEGWDESVDGSTASWSGGPLAPNADLEVGMTLRADVDPGVVELRADQRYADGDVVTWPVALTVTPGADSPSQNLAIAGVVALIGVLAVVAIALLAWRRRTP
jgi:uncharacterized protein YcnI